MATVAALNTAFQAKTSRFDRKIRKSQKRLKKFRPIVGGLNLLFSKFGAITAAVGVGAFAVLIKQGLKSADSLAKLSDRLGIATEKLAGLRHAAVITGSDAENLDKALGFMSKTLGEVALTGVGEAKQALDKLTLSMDDLLGMSPDEQVLAIADAFENLATQQEKNFVASRLFGRGGLPLVNLLDQGREGIEAFIVEAKKLGLAFSREDLAKAERANDAIARLGALIRGVRDRLAIELSPWIEKSVTALVEWATSGEGAAAKIVKGVEFVVVGIAKMGAGIEKVKGVFLVMKASLVRGLVLIAQGFFALIEGLVDIANLVPGVNFDTSGFDLIQGKLDKIAETAEGDFAKGMKLLRKDFGETEQKIKDFFAALEPPPTILQKLKKELEAVETRLTEQGFDAEKLTTDFGELVRVTEKLTSAQHAFLVLDLESRFELLQKIAREEAKRKRAGGGLGTLENAPDKLKALTVEQEKVSDSIQKAEERSKQFGETFGSALDSVAFKVQTLREAVQALLLDIAKLIFRQFVTAPIAAAIGSALGPTTVDPQAGLNFGETAAANLSIDALTAGPNLSLTVNPREPGFLDLSRAEQARIIGELAVQAIETGPSLRQASAQANRRTL